MRREQCRVAPGGSSLAQPDARQAAGKTRRHDGRLALDAQQVGSRVGHVAPRRGSNPVAALGGEFGAVGKDAQCVRAAAFDEPGGGKRRQVRGRRPA